MSYVLSRFAFVGTHLVFAYWLLVFALNDVFGLRSLLPLPSWLKLATLDVDASQIKPAGVCTPLNVDNLLNNLFFFGLWWGSHSVLARTATKKALGLLDHPVERPLFAAVATVAWFVQVHTWKPITDCSRWDPAAVSSTAWAISGTIIALGSLLIVGLLWTLPDHVFGTQKYKYQQGAFPPHKVIKGTFPYGLVRHPAAAGFLWCYWAFPAYTPNHILLASLWTTFILVGTLVFEERGILKDKSDFSKDYASYRKQVNAFVPTVNSLLTVLGLKKYSEDGASNGSKKAE